MLMSDIAAAAANLRKIGWLSQVPAEFAETVLANCKWRTIKAGQAIQHAGDQRAGIYGVGRGTIAFSTALGSADTPTMHIGHPGSWFGYIGMFTGAPLPMGVTARSDVMIAGLGRLQVEQLLAEHPEWWRHIGLLAVVYGNTAINLAADLMIRDTRRRCAASLLRIANCRFESLADAEPVDAPLSQDELAALSNMSRTTISTILRDLEADGLIKLGYRSVTVIHPARLRAVADDD
jgi:CRP/FNR family transcriptional regulator, cyclic AMP receptor protein